MTYSPQRKEALIAGRFSKKNITILYNFDSADRKAHLHRVNFLHTQQVLSSESKVNSYWSDPRLPHTSPTSSWRKDEGLRTASEIRLGAKQQDAKNRLCTVEKVLSLVNSGLATSPCPSAHQLYVAQLHRDAQLAASSALKVSQDDNGDTLKNNIRRPHSANVQRSSAPTWPTRPQSEKECSNRADHDSVVNTATNERLPWRPTSAHHRDVLGGGRTTTGRPHVVRSRAHAAKGPDVSPIYEPPKDHKVYMSEFWHDGQDNSRRGTTEVLMPPVVYTKPEQEKSTEQSPLTNAPTSKSIRPPIPSEYGWAYRAHQHVHYCLQPKSTIVEPQNHTLISASSKHSSSTEVAPQEFIDLFQGKKEERRLLREYSWQDPSLREK